MAGRKSAEESKVREYILVPSYKLAALEQAEAESVSDIQDSHSNVQVGHHRKTAMPEAVRDNTHRKTGKKPEAIDEKQPGNSNHDPEEDTDWETHSHNHSLGLDNGDSSSNGAGKKRRGISLAERRKRLRLLWLDL